MKITTIENLQQALQEAKALPWAWLRYLSRMYIGENPPAVSPHELVEGRFFGENMEIRLYNDGDGLAAVKFTDEPEDVFLDTTVYLRWGFGKELRKRRYVEFDEDGQAYIACTRLVEWKGV